MKEAAKNNFLLACILAAILSSYFLNIGYLPLWDPDEPYYIESAREMIDRGDYITPYFNYEPRLNKPIFFYWMQIISGRVFGFNEFSARFPSLVAGIALILLIYKFGSLLYSKQTGLISALIGATSFEIYVLSRQAVTDMCLAFFMTLALYGYASVQIAKKGGGQWYLFYIGTALAVITKGPVGLLLPGLIIFIIMIVQKDLSIIHKMHIIKGIGIFFIIASPWYIAVLIQHGFSFFKEFIIENNLLRYVTPMYKHTGGVLYYVPVIILGFFPWIIFLFLSINRYWLQLKMKRISFFGKKNPASFAFLLNIVWFASYLLFFSFSGSKLPSYILGLFPALSLFTASGLTIDAGKKSRFSAILRPIHQIYFWIVVIALMLILRYSFFENWRIIFITLAALLITVIVFYLIKSPFGKSYISKEYSSIFTSTLTAMIILFITANLFLFPAMEEYFPIKKLGQLTAVVNIKNYDVIAYRYYEPSMVFYSQNKIIFSEKPEDLLSYLEKNKPFYAFITLRHFNELTQDIKNELSVLSYGPRYRNRIKNAESLFIGSNGKHKVSRGLLLIYHPARSVVKE